MRRRQAGHHFSYWPQKRPHFTLPGNEILCLSQIQQPFTFWNEVVSSPLPGNILPGKHTVSFSTSILCHSLIGAKQCLLFNNAWVQTGYKDLARANLSLSIALYYVIVLELQYKFGEQYKKRGISQGKKSCKDILVSNLLTISSRIRSWGSTEKSCSH